MLASAISYNIWSSTINNLSKWLYYAAYWVNCFFASKCILFPNFKFNLCLEFGTNSVYEWLNFKMFCLHCRIWYTLHWEVASLAGLAGFLTVLPSVMQALQSHDLSSSCSFYFRYWKRIFESILQIRFFRKLGALFQHSCKWYEGLYKTDRIPLSWSVSYMPLLLLNRISFSSENFWVCSMPFKSMAWLLNLLWSAKYFPEEKVDYPAIKWTLILLVNRDGEE